MTKTIFLLIICLSTPASACLVKFTSFNPNTDIDKSIVYFESKEIVSIKQIRFGFLYTKICNAFGNCISVYETPIGVENLINNSCKE